MTTSRDGGPEVTVAVVSWNTRSLLTRCLHSLQADAQSGLAEVWVLDNASADGSADAVREDFPWANLIASSENLGFGRAVNEIAARTQSAWIAPANADVQLRLGTLQQLIEHGKLYPHAGVLAPRLILPDGSTQHSAFPFPTVPFTLAYCSGAVALSHRLARHWCIGRGFDRDREQEVPWAVGAFLLIRRAAWEQAGGFAEDQWMYAEDLDLGWRLKRSGWSTRYVPTAHVFHAESASTIQAWGDARHDRWHASTYAWMLRRRGLAITRLVALINVFSFLVRAAVSLPAALLGMGRAKRMHRDALNAARAHRVGLRSREVLSAVR
jgi:GT2 family glycosyltransferase